MDWFANHLFANRFHGVNCIAINISAQDKYMEDLVIGICFSGISTAGKGCIHALRTTLGGICPIQMLWQLSMSWAGVGAVLSEIAGYDARGVSPKEGRARVLREQAMTGIARYQRASCRWPRSSIRSSRSLLNCSTLNAEALRMQAGNALACSCRARPLSVRYSCTTRSS